MAFENVFRGINYMAPVQARQNEQAQFLNILGQSLDRAQRQNEFEDRMRQREVERAQDLDLRQQQLDLQRQRLEQPRQFNLNDASNVAQIKAAQGLPLSPQEQAAIDVKQAQLRGELNPQTGAYMPAPSLIGASMGQPRIMDAPSPVATPQAAVQSTPQAVSEQVATDVLEGPQFPTPATTPLPEQFAGTPVGERLRYEERREQRAKTFDKELEFAQKKYETGKALPVVSKTLDDLDEITDKLKAKEAMISGDQGILDNLTAKWGSSWLGRETQSVTNPEIESLRQEYDRKRDGMIPYYIVANDLPATVVDTEEFQQRILAAFGDPSLTYDANKAAINNMRMQFGVESEKQAETPSNGGWSIKLK